MIKEVVRTEYIEKLRDTTVYIPADSSYIRALLECDSLGNVMLKQFEELRLGKSVRPSVRIVDNYIEVDCTTEDSMAIYITFKDRFESSDRLVEDTSTVKESSDVREKIVKTRMPAMFWIIGIIILAVVVIMLLRKFGIFKLF